MRPAELPLPERTAATTRSVPSMATDPELSSTCWPATSTPTVGYRRGSIVAGGAAGVATGSGAVVTECAFDDANDDGSEAGNDSADASWTRSPLTGPSASAG